MVLMSTATAAENQKNKNDDPTAVSTQVVTATHIFTSNSGVQDP